MHLKNPNINNLLNCKDYGFLQGNATYFCTHVAMLLCNLLPPPYLVNHKALHS